MHDLWKPCANTGWKLLWRRRAPRPAPNRWLHRGQSLNHRRRRRRQHTHIAELARRHFPEMKIIARAKDARHAFALSQLGISESVCEAEAGGIGLGEAALRHLGFGRWRRAALPNAFAGIRRKLTANSSHSGVMTRPFWISTKAVSPILISS